MNTSGAPSLSARHVLLLGLVFLLSGFSGLVYEVVWMRMLIRVFGITIYAVSTVLTVFMAGLAIGSFAAGRWFRRVPPSMGWYAAIEAGIGLVALGSTAAIDALPQLFVAGTQALGGGPAAGFVLRLLLALLVLFPPTFLMGATLPLLSGFVTSRGARSGRGIGLLYGVNALGAVAGVVLSGFVMLDQLGEWRSCLVAAALNVSVAALVAGTFRGPAGAAGGTKEVAEVPPEHPELVWLYAVSGFCALAYQVVWSRLLIVVLGNSVYGFASMLASYLLGLGLGGVLMARWSDRVVRPLRAFAFLQVAIALLSLVSLSTFAAIGAAETRSEYLYSTLWSGADVATIPLSAMAIVFPTTLAMGALFPLVARLCVSTPGSAPTAVGRIYGWNTVGSIAGSFLTGFVLIPGVGTRFSLVLAAGLSLCLGFYGMSLSHQRERRLARGPLLAVAILLFLGGLAGVLEDPFLRVFKARLGPKDVVVLHREDKAATVTIVERKGILVLYINGLGVSSNYSAARLLIHYPSLFHPDPRSTLLVGLGVGQAFRGSLDQGCETTVIELVETVLESFPLFAGAEAARYRQDPKGRIVVTDARAFLQGTQDRYDVLLVDGSPPIYASGTVNLYSREFVNLARDHLTSEGIFALWLPALFESDFWTISRSFADAFPQFTVVVPGWGDGCFLLGSRSSQPLFDVSGPELRRRIEARRWPLDPVFGERLAASRIPDAEALRRRALATPPVTDDRPRTEFPLLRFLREEPFGSPAGFLRKK